jgi:hypothetical protein
MLLPLSHGRPPDVRIEWGEPAALVGAKGNEVTVARADGRRDAMPVERFTRAFVDASLP